MEEAWPRARGLLRTALSQACGGRPGRGHRADTVCGGGGGDRSPPAGVASLADEPTASPSPSLHLRFDPRTKTLSWDCQANATGITCSMTQEDTGATKVKVRSA